MKILLIDDDPDIVNALKVIIESKNYTFVSASNKETGMEALNKEKPDLLILDVILDTLSDGFDISRELRKIPEFEKLPVIMLTGIDDKTGVSFKSAFGQSEMLPVNAYLEKPVSAEILLAEIDKYLPK